MTITRTYIASVLTAAAFLVAGAGSAQAAVFCVNVNNCLGTDKATIDIALTDAENNGQPDAVFIGAKATPYADGNGFSYVSNEVVHIFGAGRDETALEATAFSNTLTLLSPSSTVEDLTLNVPDMSNGAGLRWNGTASDVEIVHNGASQSTLGSQPEGSAVLEDSKIDVNGGFAVSGQNVNGAVIRDSSITSGTSGVGWTGTSLNFSRVSITAPRSAIQASGNTTSTIDNVLLRNTPGGNPVDPAIAVQNGADVVVSHATIVGSGSKRGVVVGASSADTNATVFNSIVTGFENSFLRSGSGFDADLGISYTSYEPNINSSGDGSLTQGAGNVTNVTPEFRSLLLGDYRLKAPSPLIDAADPNSPTTLDRLGDPREVDGDGAGGVRADMGAFEYQYQAPTAQLGGPDTAEAGAQVAFSSTGSNDPDGEGLTRSWTFGDGGTAQGSSPSHTYAAAGTYTVTLTVTDPAGRTGTASKQIVVTAVPGAGGGAGGGGQDAGGGGGEDGSGEPEPGAEDRDAPETTLGKVRVRGETVRLGFSSDDSGATFECALDRKRAKPCASPKRYAKLDEGKHRIAVVAIDAAGNRDASPAKSRFKVED